LSHFAIRIQLNGEYWVNWGVGNIVGLGVFAVCQWIDGGIVESVAKLTAWQGPDTLGALQELR
jgi:hypothetical protein